MTKLLNLFGNISLRNVLNLIFLLIAFVLCSCFSQFTQHPYFTVDKSYISFGECVEVELHGITADDIRVPDWDDFHPYRIDVIDDTHLTITLVEDVSGYFSITSPKCDSSYIIDII